MKIHVYFMPGMSAKPTIFEYIKLPEETYEIHWLDWKVPYKKEPLAAYAKRMCDDVKHDNVILVGVSLGGMIVQEMSRYIHARRLVLISTVKSKYELPPYMRLGRKTKLYKMLPTGMAKHYKKLESWPVGRKTKTRLKLYDRYIGPDSKPYLDWAIEKVLNWDQEEAIPGSIHIHGDRDHIFPIKYIRDCFVISGGTHMMIIDRHRWFNTYLPRLIKNGKV